MKSKLLYLLAVVVLASCSAPRYSYNFDHYNYNAGKKKKVSTENLHGLAEVQPEQLTASIESTPVLVAEEVTAPKTEVRKTYVQMTKAERKALRNHLKAEFKNHLAEKKIIKEAHATQGMDRDLKLAAIFGAVGIVGLAIGGDIFYIIGGIALIIGVVFFVKWLIRQ